MNKEIFISPLGGVVNSAIALADARGIHKATGSGQLNGLGRGWSKSFMERMGFVMTNDTKPAKMLPPNSEELKESYDIFKFAGRYFRGRIFSREDIFARRYFRGKIFSREDIFAGRYFRVKVYSRKYVLAKIFQIHFSRNFPPAKIKC